MTTVDVPTTIKAGALELTREYGVEKELYDSRGRYGSVRWLSISLFVIGTVLGWGLVTNTYADWLTWQGYLLGPVGLGGKAGSWAYANLGVLAALVLGYLGQLHLSLFKVPVQEERA